jgi:hypothetical protein
MTDHVEVGTVEFWTDGWHDRTPKGFDRPFAHDAQIRLREGATPAEIADTMSLRPSYVDWLLTLDVDALYADPEYDTSG